MLFDLHQYSDAAFLFLRLVIAIIFIYHAWPKITKPQMMAKGMGTGSSMIVLLGLCELLGALAVLLGVYLQIGAALLALVMLGATYFKIAKWHTPFSAMDKMGWEYDLILLAATLFLLVVGGGTIKFF